MRIEDAETEIAHLNRALLAMTDLATFRADCIAVMSKTALARQIELQGQIDRLNHLLAPYL